MSKAITLKPRMSEQTYAISSNRVYVFDVDPSVNKHEVAEAVASTYEVTVLNVRTSILKGKKKRVYKNKRFIDGKRVDIKKAYVTLKEGDAIPIFASVEEAEQKEEQVTQKLDKKADKEAKKVAKKEKKDK